MADTETFQHYQVLKNPDGSLFELGRGAMGVTYKAFDTSLHCNVALKVINTTYLDSEMARNRFVREARAAARLSHPNVASVFYFGEVGGNFFYAMEFISGETVESFVRRRGTLPPSVALRITLQVASALRAASREGLVHRDIKPANLMLRRDEEDSDSDDDEIQVKVIDFGLAKASRKDGSEAAATLTIAGFVGTPHFASPEQLQEHDLDVRSDIYSLGVTLWYMLTGKTVFSGPMVQIMSKHIGSPPPFEMLAGQSPDVVRLLEHMLHKDPDDRPQTASALRREIEGILHVLEGRSTGAIGGAAGGHAVSDTGSTAGTSFPTESFTHEQTPPTARMPETGVALDGHYRLLQQIAQGPRGTLFKAKELDKDGVFALKVLPPELLSTAEAVSRLDFETDKARSAPHPNLLQVRAFEHAGAHQYLTYEWVNGFSLIELLRHRRSLAREEAFQLLEPLAAAADHARQHDLAASLDFSPAQVLLAFDSRADLAARMSLLDAPLTGWPTFQPKIFPLALTPEGGSSDTWANQQTVVPARDEAPGALRQLALLTYELFGGAAAMPGPAGSAARFSPLPMLSERGNAVLRDALGEQAQMLFPSASDFVRALRDEAAVPRPTPPPPPLPRSTPVQAPVPVPPPPPPGSSPGARSSFVDVQHASSVPGPAPAPLPPVQDAMPTPPHPAPLPQFPPAPPYYPPPLQSPLPVPGTIYPGQQTSTVPPRNSLTPMLVLGSVFLVAVLCLGGAGYLVWQKYFQHQNGGGGGGQAEVSPTPDPRLSLSTPTPTPEDVPTPTPTRTPNRTRPTATPPPDSGQDYQRALAEAQQLNRDGAVADAFDAYVALAEKYPDRDPSRGILNSFLSDLRGNPQPPEIDRRRFASMRPALERAANLGASMAMLELGDRLLKADPAAAAEWYVKASDQGESDAMVALGNLSFNNVTPGYSRNGAARWFQMASDKGSARGKLYLALCYEDGIGGMPKNPAQSFQLLNEALAIKSDYDRALVKLGEAYERGSGTAPNTKRAFELMSQAASLGNVDAIRSLGTYYVKGIGTPINQRLAAQRFKEGVEKQDADCMFFYAQCLENGVGVPKNLAEAHVYYRSGAENGSDDAKAWCRRNNVGFRSSN